jgi:hypothetical protein
MEIDDVLSLYSFSSFWRTLFLGVGGNLLFCGKGNLFERCEMRRMNAIRNIPWMWDVNVTR